MKKWNSVIQSTYATPAITLASGKGIVVTDTSGKKYLDFLAGIATNVLGHANPVIAKAVSKQISTLGHVSNLYAHPNALHLASELQEMTGDKSARIYFCNSGAEANEAALKLSRKTGRKQIIATEGSFHGRTMGALSLTGQSSKKIAFYPLLSDVKHLRYGDIAAMTKAMNKKVAMVIVEPILGEAGVIVPPEDYLYKLRQLCDKHGALLVFDCVQTGMGRTGSWFGYEYSGVKPDVITLAKGLGGGLPLGAMIALGEAAQLFQPGDHGSTFGGNPVSTAAAIVVIDQIKRKKLLKHVREMGNILISEIALIPGVKEVRGQGLLLGIELDHAEASNLATILTKNGVLVNAANSSTIRIAPALTVTRSEVEKFIKVLRKSMGELGHG